MGPASAVWKTVGETRAVADCLVQTVFSFWPLDSRALYLEWDREWLLPKARSECSRYWIPAEHGVYVENVVLCCNGEVTAVLPDGHTNALHSNQIRG